MLWGQRRLNQIRYTTVDGILFVTNWQLPPVHYIQCTHRIPVLARENDAYMCRRRIWQKIPIIHTSNMHVSEKCPCWCDIKPIQMDFIDIWCRPDLQRVMHDIHNRRPGLRWRLHLAFESKYSSEEEVWLCKIKYIGKMNAIRTQLGG